MALLSGIMLFVALMIPGYLLGRSGKLDSSSVTGITNILMYLAMPLLVFAKLLRFDFASLSAVDLCASVCSAFLAVLTVYVLGLIFFRETSRHCRTCRFCATFSNCGFLGIPLAETVFPSHPEVVLFLSVFNAVSTFLLLIFGVKILSGQRKKISVGKVLCSPVLIAILLGTAGAFAKWKETWPMLADYADLLGGLTTPLSMLLLGAELSALSPKAIVRTGEVYSVAALKLLAAPCITVLPLLLLRFFGVGLSESLITAVFIATAVSTAASAPAMSQKYDADGEFAAILTLGNTLLCLCVLPLLFLLLKFLLGGMTI